MMRKPPSVFTRREQKGAWRAACARLRERTMWWKHWLRVARKDGMSPCSASFLKEQLLDAQTYMHLSDCSVHAVVTGDHTVSLIALWHWMQQMPDALEHARVDWQSEATCSVTRARWLWQQLSGPLTDALARIRAVFDSILDPFVKFGMTLSDAERIFDVLGVCHHAARLGADGVDNIFSESARARHWHKILPLIDILTGNSWEKPRMLPHVEWLVRERRWRAALDKFLYPHFRVFKDLFGPASNERDTTRSCRLVYPDRNGALVSDVRVTTHENGSTTHLAFYNTLNGQYFPRSQLPIARIEELYAEHENSDADTVVAPCPWTPERTYWHAIREDIDWDLKYHNSRARLMYAHGRMLILDNPALPILPVVLLDENATGHVGVHDPRPARLRVALQSPLPRAPHARHGGLWRRCPVHCGYVFLPGVQRHGLLSTAPL